MYRRTLGLSLVCAALAAACGDDGGDTPDAPGVEFTNEQIGGL